MFSARRSPQQNRNGRNATAVAENPLAVATISRVLVISRLMRIFSGKSGSTVSAFGGARFGIEVLLRNTQSSQYSEAMSVSSDNFSRDMSRTLQLTPTNEHFT